MSNRNFYAFFSVLLVSHLHFITEGVPIKEPLDGTLFITAFQRLQTVYIDGVNESLINGNMWNQTDRLALSATNRLIAVSAIGDGTCGGLLASFGDSYVLTSAQWRCSRYQVTGWYNLGFDDESEYWLPAQEYGSNWDGHSGCSHLWVIPDISGNAQWIWVDELTEQTIFCRGYTGMCDNSPCLNNGTCLQNEVRICLCPPKFTGTFCENGLNRTLTITAKSIIYDLYIDGIRKNLSNAADWQIPDEIELSPFSRLIGVMAIDSTATCPGVIGSVTGDYLVTDANNWKCHYTAAPDWYRLGWDDSEWPPAYVVGPNNNVTWPTVCDDALTGISSISPNANWIWTDFIPDAPVYHSTIYCRGYLQRIERQLHHHHQQPWNQRPYTYTLCELESPCLNGGTCNKNNQTLCSCPVGFVGDFCEIETGAT